MYFKRKESNAKPLEDVQGLDDSQCSYKICDQDILNLLTLSPESLNFTNGFIYKYHI